jgi:hypothetical protein
MVLPRLPGSFGNWYFAELIMQDIEQYEVIVPLV